MIYLWFALAVLAAYAYGVATMRWQVFPYSVLKRLTYSGSNPAGKTSYWATKVSVFATSRAEVVMFGDSMTEVGQWAFDGVSVANHGIASEATMGFLDRVEATIQAGPRLVFVQGGTNDLKGLATPESIAANLIAVAMRFHGAGIEVVLQSAVPTRAFHLRDYVPKLHKVNQLLADWCQKSGVHFLDLTPALCRDGVIREEFTLDGTHPNGEGCREWSNAILPFVKRYARLPT